MKRFAVLLFVLLMICFAGCDAVSEPAAFHQISAEGAKAMMDGQEEVLVIDVREQYEYNEGHIPGALLFPVGTISEARAAEMIPDKDTVILVYCRSGNRSKTASQALVDLGYTHVYEFGGIIHWNYEIE